MQRSLGLASAILATILGPATLPAQDPGRTMVGVQDLSWSADGRRLYFSAMRVKPDFSDYAPDKWAVYAYDLESNNVSLIAAAAFSVHASPVSDRIIVGRLVSGNRDLFLLDATGAEIARLTSDPAEDFAAAWSPDGRQIAFNSKRNGHSELFLASSDGSGARRLVDAGAERSLNPAWSPDGQVIAYFREKGDGRDQIHIVRPDGSGDRVVTSDTFNNVFPGWTPAGRIIYGRGLRGRPTLAHIIDIDGTGASQLLGIGSFFVRYSPDGRRIAWLEEHPEAEGIRVVVGDTAGRVIATVSLEKVGRAASTPMDRLASLVGQWDVEFDARSGPNEAFTPLRTQSTISPLLGGAFLQETVTMPVPGGARIDLIGLWSYDRFRSVYRFAWLDNTYALFDVHEGNFDGHALVVSNLRTRTTLLAGNREIFSRMIWSELNAHAFRVESLASTDGGASWFTQVRGRYSRRGPAPQPPRAGH